MLKIIGNFGETPYFTAKLHFLTDKTIFQDDKNRI